MSGLYIYQKKPQTSKPHTQKPNKPKKPTFLKEERPRSLKGYRLSCFVGLYSNIFMEFIQMRSISGSNKAVPEKLSSFPAAQVIAEAHWTKVFNTLLLGWD